jgi:MFS transporter, UMF1 family
MKNRWKIFVWTLYDFANTSFSIVVVTAIFAVYFKKTIAGGEAIGDLYWSLATSISMIITAIIAPILGAIADHSAGKKRFLLFFSLLCILGTASLYFTGSGTILFAMVIFILSNVGFEAALVFYDAFLPELTEQKNFGRVSGYGFAMGYLGSFGTLAIAWPFINNHMIKETFPIASLFFLIFAIPIFLFLRDNRKDVKREESYFKIGFDRVYNTITHLKNYKNLTLFLIAFFFYIEGVNTVIFFAGNYASTTIGFSETEVLIFFLTVQSTAIIGSILFGVISDSYGQKKTIIISLFLWMVTVVYAFFVKDKTNFYIVGLLAGSVMGATQSTSRSLMAKLTPVERKTEFFGFYSFFGKSSAVLGPLVFGLVSYITKSQRFAILSIIFFFIVGIVFMTKVEDTKVTSDSF